MMLVHAMTAKLACIRVCKMCVSGIHSAVALCFRVRNEVVKCLL
ncbi:hypothetical protein HMPREF1572_00911 [Gardnerella vaginalis JCP7275]|nr:hypothetical protein HMPREF1572_00911 [Gardnerella vaginalis JCP7275]